MKERWAIMEPERDLLSPPVLALCCYLLDEMREKRSEERIILAGKSIINSRMQAKMSGTNVFTQLALQYTRYFPPTLYYDS